MAMPDVTLRTSVAKDWGEDEGIAIFDFSSSSMMVRSV